MKESDRLEYSNLPREVNLKAAFELNQQLWRRRDNFLSASSPMEVPEKLTRRVFDMVQEKFASYILDDFHKTKRPLVGFSLLPEMPVPWGYGYYYADFGKNRRMRFFEEFATEWLTNVACGYHPYRANSYLGKVNSHIEKRNPSIFNFEDELLASIVNKIEKNKISDDQLTDMFARILIAGDLDYYKEIGFETGKMKAQEDAAEIVQIEIGSPFYMAILRPRLFTKSSMRQVQNALGGVTGTTSFPGVVNLSGYVQLSKSLAHEYVHTLSYHEDNKGGIPIKGYKLGGAIFKQNGKA